MPSKVQMQGRNTATQELVTWLADSPDWDGLQSPYPVADVTLYARGRAAINQIACVFTYPAPAATLVVSTVVTLTGTITVPGSVVATKKKGAVVTTLGSATVVGLNWSYSYTLQVGDVGAITFGASATATTGGSTASAHVDVTVAFPAAVAAFLAGQSNAGNQDGVPGTVDGRVTLTWANMYSTTIFGPGAMALQSGGHSFEWQCGADLAAYYSANVLFGKFWADGNPIKYFLPSVGLQWPTMSNTLNNLAAQWVAAGVTRVLFGWCQGEANASNSFAADLSTFEADTSSLFDSVKTLLAGYGLGVHFYVLKTNIHVPTGTNPGDIDAAQLVTVRAAQDHLSVTRTDTTAVSFDSVNPVLHLHYAFGETNTCGAIWSGVIKSEYP